ncbi:acyl-CoA thioesterase [Facilibium subflavum]|uniref:acyl-CoA thioesterase n=1 Tax=Facilibium subflavum TaxID=2219058 RepID=UPI000E6522AD|nr:thioesterase family protein [Facilibium subflavum]
MYFQNLNVDDAHIDFQGIVDGLYYPFYMEKVRHDYLKDAFGLDIVEQANKGNLFVLASYEIKFKHSLKKGDALKVTCQLKEIKGVKFIVYQEILVDGKVCAQAEFIVTCVPKSGGRPFIPEEIKQKSAQIADS